jgi:hypothetical protein
MLWNNIEVIGRRLIQSNTLPGETVRSPAVNPQFKAEKTFKARVVLMNRESVLTEDTRLRPSQRFAYGRRCLHQSGGPVRTRPPTHENLLRAGRLPRGHLKRRVFARPR